MDVVSLFAGIGGFDLGFDHAGFRIVAHVEKDANCRKLLAAKWPNAMAFDDVCTVGKHNLPECEVVCGGSPCQGFSVAGLRKGMNDDRSNLASEFVRICDECGPTYVVWENVPGVLSMPDNSFGNFIAAMVGEDEPFVSPHGGKWKCAGVAVGPKRAIAWRVLDAQWFGVAQRRRRVFLVGVAHGRDGGFPSVDSAAERACQILFECEGVRRNTPPSREAGKVAPCLAASGVGAGRTCNERNEVDFCIEIQSVAGTLSCNTGPNGHDAGNFASNQGVDAGYLIPDVACCLSDRGTVDRGDSAHNSHLIPEVCGCLSDGAHSGGGLTDRTPTPGASFPPSVANTLTRRMHKGPNTTLDEWQTLIPSGGGFDDGEKCFGIDEEQNAAENLMGCLKARKEGGGFEAAVAFNMIGQVNMQGSKGMAVTDEGKTAFTLNAMHGHDVHAVAFHDVAGTLKDRGGNHAGNGAEEADRIVGCRDVAQAITQNYGKQPDNSDTALGPNVVSFAQNQLGEVRTGDVAGTVNTNSNASGRNTAMAKVAMSVRRLTPTECERLQGFPDGWTAGFADSTRYKMLGNAVCRNVGEWLAFRISK